jgi:hypothetical protein
MTLQAFESFFIDFVGPINPPGKCTGARYIITLTEYLTRWAKARAVKNCSATTTARFIFEDIITRFGCTKILMSDQGTHFIKKTVEALTEDLQSTIRRVHLTIHKKKKRLKHSTRSWRQH